MSMSQERMSEVLRESWGIIAQFKKKTEEMEARIKELEAQKDSVYRERDMVLALAYCAMDAMGMPVGLGRHPDSDTTWEDDWRNIVYIETYDAQLSWHIHDSEVPWFIYHGQYKSEWDGHTTEEKYKRLLKFVGYDPDAKPLGPEDIPF